MQAGQLLCFNNVRIWCEGLVPVGCIWALRWLRLLSALRGGSVVGDSLFVVLPIVCGGSVFGPCFVIQY